MCVSYPCMPPCTICTQQYQSQHDPVIIKQGCAGAPGSSRAQMPPRTIAPNQSQHDPAIIRMYMRAHLVRGGHVERSSHRRHDAIPRSDRPVAGRISRAFHEAQRREIRKPTSPPPHRHIATYGRCSWRSTSPSSFISAPYVAQSSARCAARARSKWSTACRRSTASSSACPPSARPAAAATSRDLREVVHRFDSARNSSSRSRRTVCAAQGHRTRGTGA